MTARVNFAKSELEKIYNKLNESYEYVNIARLENDNRFIKIFELLVDLSEKSNNLSKVLRAAVCKYRELAVKWKFRNSSYSVRKNPLVKRFRKSQSKFLKSFLFRENRQKVKSSPTPYSLRSKTFELDHFQSPREERRFEETSSSLAGK